MIRIGLSGDFMKGDGSPAFPQFDLTPLNQDEGVEWRYVPVRNGRIAAEDVAGVDALILLAARFDSDSFPKDGRLALIARFGVGYDAVDVEACTRNQVALTITPNGVRRPVAVSIITFVLALSGRLLQKDRITREGPAGWAKRSGYMGEGLIGRTLGSIGVGNIGAEMFRMAAPFGMRFLASDPYADPAMAASLGIELVSVEELFSRSDYLAVNCPLTPDTIGLVNAERIAMMRPGSFVINTARGPIVDQRALYQALVSGHLAGAGIDVFEQEPVSADEPLLGLDNVIVTPHALCWTDQCFAGIGADTIAAAMAVRRGNMPDGIVNRSVLDDPLWRAKLLALASRG